MPILENGKTVEDVYWDHVRSISPAEKIRTASRLNVNVGAMVQTKLRDEHPEWDDIDLKIAVAKRFYQNDPKAVALLNEAERIERSKKDV